MMIVGFQKLTLLDYPNEVAAIVFTKGCNFKCPFCQNSCLLGKNNDYISSLEVLEYLKKRSKLLDGLVISGGEPTLQKDLKDFIIKVKQIGLKVKLDTNGYNYEVIKELIDNNLVDYIAMDIKNIYKDYSSITGFKNIKIDNIKKSIKLIENSNIDYEFRTTIVKEYHDINKIKEILKIIDKKSKYFLQNFNLSENVLNKKLHSFTHEELIEFNNILKKEYNNVFIRGLYSDSKEEVKCIK